MSIYRGAGGAGDAVADSSSEALLVRELAIEVQADADAAAASATNASNSASSASTSATNAANSASAASTSATSAASSASTATTKASEASTSATNAATSASAASTSASAAATSATNASSSASSASTSASTATTQATNASNSASAAATSATNASNSATAAATSATNAASSASSASTSASSASTSASNALASANDAETSKNLAANYASNSAVSAADALGSAEAADISEANAASSASAASTSATNAASSASSASTSATNAANSATSAGSSATSAAASAAAAAASYDSFDDRYLGTKTAAPTLDNDGNALVTGALYYNSGAVTPADKGMWVYDGSQWIAASAASTAILTVYRYTATAGQTTFTGADDNSLTLTYTPGSAIITINGTVMEVGTDVTATTGTSIVLAQAALVGDEVNIYAFATFNVANTYTQSQADAAFLPKSNPSYTGTLTGGTGVVNLGSGQFYKDASGNVGIGTSSPGFKLHTVGGNVLFQNSGTVIQYISSSNGGATRLGFDSSGVIYNWVEGQSGGLRFATADTERMRIDSSGNVCIGTTSAAAYAKLTVNGGNAYISHSYGNTLELNKGGGAALYFSYAGGAADALLQGTGSGGLQFYTGNSLAERMRITSGGALLVNTTSALGSCTHTIYADANSYALGIQQANTSGSVLRLASAVINGTQQLIYGGNSTGTASVIVYTNGNIQNTNNSYGALSDIKLKENIVDATPKLADLMKVKVRQYNLKSDETKAKQIGVVAQELEEVFAGMVDTSEDKDNEGNELGTQTKSVKYSVFVPMLIKAIQEQQAMIEELKAEVAALKGTV